MPIDECIAKTMPSRQAEVEKLLHSAKEFLDCVTHWYIGSNVSDEDKKKWTNHYNASLEGYVQLRIEEAKLRNQS